MHIPDGLLSPQTYLPAYAVAVPLWAYTVRRSAAGLDEALIPRLGVLTALAFVLSALMVPLPGGTSGHLVGVALLALAFGPWLAFLAYTVVLALQAVLFGAGGITALPVSALAMGLLGGFVAAAIHRLLRNRHAAAAVIVATWLSVVASAVVVALVLGLQPAIAHSDGSPLFFPFGPAVTVPAVVGPHLVLGLGEGVLTWLILSRLQQRHWGDAP